MFIRLLLIIVALGVSHLSCAGAPAVYDGWSVSGGTTSTASPGTADCPAGFTCSAAVTGTGFFQRQVVSPSGDRFFQTMITDGSTTPDFTSATLSNFACDGAATTSFWSSSFDNPLALIPVSGNGTASLTQISTLTQEASLPLGGSPYGIVISGTGRYAYVTDHAGSTVSVVDLYKRVVIATIPVGNHPAGVAFDSRQDKLYVANEADATISVVDTHKREVIATIPVGTSPDGVVIDPLGVFVYVLNRSDATVSVIDAAANKVVDVITVGTPTHTQARDIVIDRAGLTVYVTLGDNGGGTTQLIKLDTANHQTTSIIKLEGYPTAIALRPGGSLTYIAVDSSAWACGRIYEVDMTAPAVSRTLNMEHGINTLVMADDIDLYVINGVTQRLGRVGMVGKDMVPHPRTMPLGAATDVVGNFIAKVQSFGVVKDPNKLDFGQAPTDKKSEMTVNVRNIGLYPFKVTKLDIVRGSGYGGDGVDGVIGLADIQYVQGYTPPPLPYSIASESCSGATIPPDDYCAVTVAFDPTVSSEPGTLAIVAKHEGGLGLERTYRVDLLASRITLTTTPTSSQGTPSQANGSGSSGGGGGFTWPLCAMAGLALARSRTRCTKAKI